VIIMKSQDDRTIMDIRTRTPVEMAHLVQKLRWMGMEEEARKMLAELGTSRDDCEQILPTAPIDTD